MRLRHFGSATEAFWLIEARVISHTSKLAPVAHHLPSALVPETHPQVRMRTQLFFSSDASLADGDSSGCLTDLEGSCAPTPHLTPIASHALQARTHARSHAVEPTRVRSVVLFTQAHEHALLSARPDMRAREPASQPS